MRIVDYGEVFGHFVIPFVDEDETRKSLSEALTGPMLLRPGIERTGLTSIAGECDLLLHLQLKDFRLVADLQAEVIDSHSHASSWVYAVPYGETPARSPQPDRDLEFFIYLRVHRHFYACYGASGERELHGAIQNLLGDGNGQHLSGRVLYSLGWPDLIVQGSLSSDIQHLRRLIVSLQSLSFPTQPTHPRRREGRVPVFLKTITLIGMPMALSGRRNSRPRRGPGATLRQPVLFGRSQPGLVFRAIRTLGRVLQKGGATAVTSWAMNGTWDLIVTSPTDEPISLAQFDRAFRSSRGLFAKHGIERTQTHLLTSTAADLESLRVPPAILRPRSDRPLLAARCDCSREHFEDLRELLKQASADNKLPRGLTRTISHALDMFRHTLRDTSNCCDSAGSLKAHAQGLRVLLNLSIRSHQMLSRTPETSVASQALIATEISYINDHLTEWCKRAGRVAREKTAGSGARLFLQIDSIVAQRGAIPKILMIAERIMKDFYHQLPRELHGPRGPQRDHFAAILEPLGNVTSQPLMGLVSIPIRYAFALHLVVPQLWHEVGQYVFWAEHSPSHRPSVDLEISQRTDSSMTPSDRMNEAFFTDFHLRADMFADLLVFCFGFGGSLRPFSLYLASLTANVAKHDNLHRQSWEKQALALVHRLCFVAQFVSLQRRMKTDAPRVLPEFRTECRKIQKALISGDERPVRKVIAFLLEVSRSDGWPRNFPIPPNLAGTVVKNFQGKVYELCLRDMEVLAYALQSFSLDGPAHNLDPSDWSSIENGVLVEFQSDQALQAAYREFYLEELKALLAGNARRSRSGQFRKMATLGRSALLRIYQSEGFSP